MEVYVRRHGMSVIEQFVGHGIGQSMHEDPQVPNSGPPGKGPKLRDGMVLAIEPMVNVGGPEVHMASDGRVALERILATPPALVLLDFNLPGLNGFLEMQHLVDAGMSPAQVFRAATIDNAAELERPIGAILPGREADIIAVGGDPLAAQPRRRGVRRCRTPLHCSAPAPRRNPGR